VPNTVSITVDADTKKAEKSVQGMGDKFRSAMKGVAMAAGGITLAAGAAAKLGEEYQEATNTIAAGTGASGEQLEGLTQSFRDVWKEVPQDAATVSSAIADINTEFGFTDDRLESVTGKMLIASRAMGEDLGGIIKSTADLLVAFGEDKGGAEDLLDKLTVAAQFSGTSMQGLADKVIDFGPQLNELGLSMDDAIALIANMESAGLNAGKMMPGLNKAIGTLAKEGVTDISAGLQEMIDGIQNAETDSEGLALAVDAFGAGAGIRFKDAIDKGVFSLGDMLKAMEDSGGVLAELGETTLTMSDKFDIMKNRAKDALVPIGKFATALGPIAIMAPAIATGIAAMASSQLVATAATWLQTAATAALNVAMGPIGLIILGIVAAVVLAIAIFKNWDKIVQFFKDTWETVSSAISEAFSKYFAWLLPGGALPNAIETVKQTWDSVWNAVKETWATVSGAIFDAFNSKWGWLLPGGALIKAIQLIKQNWDDIWAAIEILAIVAWEKISEAFIKYFGWALPGGAIHTALNKIKELWDSVWAAVQAGFEVLSASIQAVWTDYFGWLRPGGAIDKALTTIKDAWDSAWDGIKSTFGAIGRFIEDVWTDHFAWLRPGGAIDKALDSFKAKWKTVWDAIGGFVEGPVNLIIGGINKLLDALNAIDMGWEAKKVRGVTVIPGFKFAPFSIPHIPKLAAGGIVTSPTLALLGERGPEAVIPLGSASAASITINIMGPTYGFDDFERRVTMAVRDGVRRGGFAGILASA